jgi:aryl-alcohol dehydrogenase-like predicted oxidoreductase
MKSRRIGPHLTVSAVGLGCMGMSHAYGGQDEQESIRTLDSVKLKPILS